MKDEEIKNALIEYSNMKVDITYGIEEFLLLNNLSSYDVAFMVNTPHYKKIVDKTKLMLKHRLQMKDISPHEINAIKLLLEQENTNGGGVVINKIIFEKSYNDDIFKNKKDKNDENDL